MAEPAGYPFAEAGFRKDPYPFYAQLREENPVFKTRLPNGSEVYLVTRYRDVVAASKDPRLVKNIHNARGEGLPAHLGIFAQLNNANMLRADPPEHTRLRGLVQEAFTPRYVNQMREHIQGIADRLIDAVEPRGEMDLIQDFAFPLPITVICEMLGVSLEDDREFRRWSTAFIDSGLLSNDSPQVIPEMVEAVQYMQALIESRRAEPRDDLISRLIHVQQNGDRLNEVELLATSILLLIAGHETTVNLIGNGMLALLLHPEQMELLRQQPERIRPAVEEIVRYVNPVHMVNRYAAEDVEIDGVRVPKGSHLILLVASADHDPAYRENAAELDVTQSDMKHVAFGQGMHYCLGAPLARLEGEIAFTTLLQRLPGLSLAVDPEALEWRPGVGLRGLRSLPVRF